MKLEILEYLPQRRNTKETPLLFVHGANHGAWCWKENFLPYFSSKGFPSYALSLRGHGESEGRERLHLFSLKDYMDDVIKTMLLFKKNKPVLIGHSMGGAIVQKILHLHPDKIRALVLIASVPPNGMLKDQLRLYFTNILDFTQMFLSNDGRRKAKFAAKVFFSKELPVRKRDEFIRFLQPESRKAKKDLLKKIVPKPINLSVPVLVLGSKRDLTLSERTTIYIGKSYKTEPVIFPNISHDMMLDPNWQLVADQILAFLHATKS